MKLNRYILTSLIKILIVILLAILLFLTGTMIGYGVIGDGSPFKVFSPSLWNHIFEFMK